MLWRAAYSNYQHTKNEIHAYVNTEKNIWKSLILRLNNSKEKYLSHWALLVSWSINSVCMYRAGKTQVLLIVASKKTIVGLTAISIPLLNDPLLFVFVTTALPPSSLSLWSPSPHRAVPHHSPHHRHPPLNVFLVSLCRLATAMRAARIA